MPTTWVRVILSWSGKQGLSEAWGYESDPRGYMHLKTTWLLSFPRLKMFLLFLVLIYKILYNSFNSQLDFD